LNNAFQLETHDGSLLKIRVFLFLTQAPGPNQEDLHEARLTKIVLSHIEVLMNVGATIPDNINAKPAAGSRCAMHEKVLSSLLSAFMTHDTMVPVLQDLLSPSQQISCFNFVN
jgi:hypothetical protein